MLGTNKYVISGADRLNMVFHLKEPGKTEPSGNFINVGLELSANGVLAHPDPDVDLCIISISDVIAQQEHTSRPVFFVHLARSSIPQPEDWAYFDAMEEVVMIGCPNGIYDDANKMPLARRGIAATTISKRYNGKPWFLVDMACFPGSSGSPVFVFNQNGYIDRKTNINHVGASRLLFVGVLFAGPTISNTGEIVLGNAPTFQINSICI